MNLFRGYIPVRGKTPLQGFKEGKKLLELEEVQQYNEYGGVLGENTVLIDVDDANQANRLFDIIVAEGLCCKVHQTTRGKHFFFKNDGTWEKSQNGQRLAIGIDADVKVGFGGKGAYAKLKSEGVERKCIYDEVDLCDEYDTPPFWLKPIVSKIDLFDLGDGDGRNSNLYRYLLPLTASGLSKDQARATCRLINRWILAKPVSEDELNTILRDESFDKALVPNFFDGKKFKFNEFGDYMVREFHIKRINGKLHIYDDGVYRNEERYFQNKMIQVISDLPDSKRTEVMKYLDIVALENVQLGKARYITFNNGILDIDSGNFSGFDPNIVSVNRVPWSYNPNAKSELLDNTLNKLACGDASIRALLEEMAGYCLYRRNELRKGFLLTGDRGNGKSTYLAVIETMLGRENVCNLSLKDLNHNFRPAELFGKLANIGDDIDSEYIKDTSMLKKVISGDPITIERKNKDPFAFVNYAKVILSANDIPRVADRTGAVVDRLIIIPFNARFTKDDPDYRPFIKDELCDREQIEALIVLGVKALKRVLECKSFTTSAVVEEQRKEFDLNNNPIKGFFEDVRSDSLDLLEREPVAEWYKRYCEYCLVNKMSPLANIVFSKQFMNEFKLTPHRRKIDGKTVRFYKKLS